MRIAPIVVVILWGSVISLPAEEQPRISALLNQLDSESRAERIAAQQALIEIGPRVLPSVLDAEERAPGSTRLALRMVRQSLLVANQRQAERPSQLTLIATTAGAAGKISLRQILAQFEQTENAIRSTALSPSVWEQTLEFPSGELTFWQCAEQLERTLPGWKLQAVGHEIELVPQAATEPRRVAAVDDVSSPFLVTGLFSTRSDPTSPAKRILRVQLAVTAEPRLRTMYLNWKDGDIDVDCGDRRLSHLAADARREVLPVLRTATAAVDFQLPSATAVKSVTVRGRMQARVCSVWTPIVFELADAPTADHPEVKPFTRQQQRGGMTVQFQGATPPGDAEHGWQVRLNVESRRGGPEFESHRASLVHEIAWLEVTRRTAEGGLESVQIRPLRVDLESLSDHGAQVRYQFPPFGPQEGTRPRLIYAAPLLFCDVPIVFRMEDVPGT